MIKIVDNDIWRGSSKIGWLENNRVFDEDGIKVGHYQGNDIFDTDGIKVGYIMNNRLESNDGKSFPLDDIRNKIAGSSAPDIIRAAVFLLIGDE
ncbi:MAG: hypothetical protein AAB686_00220 [Patescibacteria group bacterium]